MDGHSHTGPDPVHPGTNLFHLASELMPGDQRLADDEIAVFALEVIVQIRAADAGRTDPDQHAIRRELRYLNVLRGAGPRLYG